MTLRNIITLSSFLLIDCNNAATAKKDSKKQKDDTSLIVLKDDPVHVKEEPLKAVLLGRWRLDKAALRKEIARNTSSKVEATAVTKDFDDKYDKIEVEFLKDQRFILYVNNQSFVGIWGISSDKLSYYLQYGEQEYELHEVKSLTKDLLVELPVTSMKIAGAPVEEVVYKKVSL